MSSTRILTANRVFTGEQWLTGYAVLINDGKIIDFIPESLLASSQEAEHFDNCIIAPAFIDLQVYGANGKLLAVYPEPSSLEELVSWCHQGGTSFCLPTVATNTIEVFKKSIDAVRDYIENGGKGILGIHLEGPWINKVKKGAHIDSLIQSPSLNDAKELLEYGNGIIKMITLAPEVCSKEVIELILSYGVVVSAGHSNAAYRQAKEAFAGGITAVTHLYNAMSPMQHRKPGLVGAAMDDEKVMASIIPDGYHVDFAAVRIAKKIMGERLYAITDAVTTTAKGYYQHQPAGDKYEAGGVLSGSALTMQKALKNLVQHCGIELAEALRMCSLYPARVIRMDNSLGKIEKGLAAELVILDDSLEVIETITN
ncbi:MAG TPA: N-acetylglucosamine-6-phosphate deacetylase [Chitinophagaceae bacterium]|nr:N-acetylglucosamine-6-phosphate deacetylase [Chitinophagaceae bacterium]